MFSRFTIEPRHPNILATTLDLHPTGAGNGHSVCLVSDSSAPLSPSAADLALHLAADGWHVTLLDLAKKGAAEPSLCAVHSPIGYVRLSGLYRETQWYVPVQSLCAYHWLRERSFDLILFQHGFGAGYYSCVARRLGLAFAQTPIVAVVCEPYAMHLERSLRFPVDYQDFESNFIERETVSRADALICANPCVEKWLNDAGWTTPLHSAALVSAEEKPKTPCGRWLAALPRSLSAGDRLAAPVSISVCIATFNRPAFLREALASLQAQTHKSFEVIVMDDGSSDSAVDAVQQEFAAVFAERGWRWEKQANQGPSVARNRAASLAQGSHLLFMDDDNIAYPDELERLALAAESGADILTCVLGMHPQSTMSFPALAYLPERLGKEARPLGWMPLGNCLELAAFVNRIGDTNALFRREAFAALGGFPGDRDMIFEDFVLLAKAAIGGYRIEVVPEILLLYRRHPHSRSMTACVFAGHIDSLKPIAALLPPALRPLLLAARGEWYQRHCQRRDEYSKPT